MLNVLFDNNLKNGNFLINELDSYTYYVHKMQFNKAAKSIEICSKNINRQNGKKSCNF